MNLCRDVNCNMQKAINIALIFKFYRLDRHQESGLSQIQFVCFGSCYGWDSEAQKTTLSYHLSFISMALLTLCCFLIFIYITT